MTESHTSRSRNINPLANFAPMVNDFVAIRPIVSQEGPRKREKVVTTATTTVATTTVPGTIPSADFKAGFKRLLEIFKLNTSENRRLVAHLSGHRPSKPVAIRPQ